MNNYHYNVILSFFRKILTFKDTDMVNQADFHPDICYLFDRKIKPKPLNILFYNNGTFDICRTIRDL